MPTPNARCCPDILAPRDIEFQRAGERRSHPRGPDRRGSSDGASQGIVTPPSATSRLVIRRQRANRRGHTKRYPSTKRDQLATPRSTDFVELAGKISSVVAISTSTLASTSRSNHLPQIRNGAGQPDRSVGMVSIRVFLVRSSARINSRQHVPRPDWHALRVNQATGESLQLTNALGVHQHLSWGLQTLNCGL